MDEKAAYRRGMRPSERPRVGVTNDGLVTVMAWSERGEAVTLRLTIADALHLAADLRAAASAAKTDSEQVQDG